MGTFGGTTNFNKRIFERKNQEALRSRGSVSQIRDGYGRVLKETHGRDSNFGLKFERDNLYGEDFHITSRLSTADDMHARKYHTGTMKATGRPSRLGTRNTISPELARHYKRLGDYYNKKG